MKVASRAGNACLLVASCLLLAPLPVRAQKTSVANSAEAVRANLAEKARALESRGRPDMAIQLWQQILLSAPGDTDALAGLAKDYRLIGSTDLSNQALDRLRKINPRDPNIARIESLPSTAAESDALSHAGKLTREGRNDEAMRIYRQLYGDKPPNGDIALAYYQTLYGTSSGKPAAVAGLRELAAQNAGDPRYAVALGTLLTYDARSRAGGIRILQAHPHEPSAQAALRQALVWNSANPETASQLRQYLQAHPEDTELAGHLKENEEKLAQMNSGIARNPAERAAFAALNAQKIDDAEKRFAELLESEPDNGRVEAGAGFLRMQQKNFADAINYFALAEQHGYKTKTVDDALESSRFYLALSQATEALNANHLDVAQSKFRAALDMNPRNTDALNGLAGVYVRQQQYLAAAGVYEELVKLQPASVDGWRGLFLALARSDQNEKALTLTTHLPPPVAAALNKDPDYLRTLAAIYQSRGRDADAQRVLAIALDLPFPSNGSTLEAGTKMQYAGILMEAKRYPQALALYTQLVAGDPTNSSAWMGLISAYHDLGQDIQAIAAIEKIPPATYETALADSSFLLLLGAIYQNANQFDVAQGMLERAEKIAISSGAPPSVSLQLQLAGIDLLRNLTDQAYAIYRQLVVDHPDNADAWKGVVASLAAANRNGPARQEISQIPAAVRTQLDSDIGFIQIEAGVYSAAGDTARASQFMSRVLAYYAKVKQPVPSAVDIENAWFLYNAGNDRALYPALMRIGGRTDLTIAQREAVEDIWANWSVRRCAAAIENSDAGRAIDILDAASLAFPNNLNVRKAVAGGYARVGRAKEALALYKTIPMQDASAGDFDGAIGAALEANDRSQAEEWLRQALDRFPRDPAILSAAARYEQARGDNERAAEYYRASLAAMPPVTPADRLAHALVYPEQGTRPRRAVTAADLQRLLDPANEPFAKTATVPPVPAYGPDPYQGPAPVATPEGQLPAKPLPSPQPAPLTRPAVNFVPQSLHPPLRGNGPKGTGFSPYIGTTRRFRALAPKETFPDLCAPHLVFASLNIARPAPHTHSALQSAPASGVEPDIILNPPHSLVSDAWKRLIFSLIAGNRNAEALAELSKIPPDVRLQLEADIEWVQGVASLYVAVGDAPHASEYLKRVDNFYLLHRAQLPVAVEIQHAWLLYNIHNDAALYPVIERLDTRADLTPADHQQVSALWINWAIRRATDDLDSGQAQLGVQILQAAALQYADSMLVRRALAGAYVRAGQPQQALAVYKTVPLDSATPGDFEGAIGAAIAAGDMAQAESWLRVALARYPGDPQVLALAAHFEQARGNNQRASEFWRDALSAMPPGSDTKTLNSTLPPSTGLYSAPATDLHRLLNPNLDSHFNSGPTPQQLAPLPSFNSRLSSSKAQPDLAQHTLPSNHPLPLPSPGQETESSAPALIEQSNMVPAFVPPSAPDVYTGLASSSSDSSLEMPDTSTPAVTAVLAPAPLTSLPAPSQPLNVAPPLLAIQIPVAQPPAQQVAEPASTAAQSTPSVTDAVIGAYSAPRSTSSQPSTAAPAAPKPSPATTRTQPRKKPVATPGAQSAGQQAEQTLGNARITANAPLEHPAPTSATETSQASTETPAQSATSLSDEELAQRNLPPLRGPWARIMRSANPPSPREQAEEQLRVIEASYSGWLGGTSTINYRSGAPGYNQLAAFEAPFEASTPLGSNARLVAVAKPVFLDSGAAGGSATLAVIESTASGTSLVAIPEPIGTLTMANTAPPAQQNAAGFGGELQLIFPHLAIAGGYTPSSFLVSTFTGRFQWRPSNGPLTFSLARDSVKDSQLSYAGLRDPAGNTLTTLGQIWGGVVANQAQVQFGRGDAQSGLYFSAGGQFLTGYNVESNTRIDGTAGAYWHALTSPEYGDLTVGANIFAMHYANNQNAFTLGMGGYFSPQAYFLANVPFNWVGHWDTRWHYAITGAFGIQAFQQNSTPLWPLAAQKALEVSQGNPMLPSLTSVGPNYDLKSEVAYHLGPHWFAGANVAANNTRNYNFFAVGFFLRYTFREQPSAAAAPTGLFPTDGMRPFTVP